MIVWKVLFFAFLASVSASTPELIFPETYNDRTASLQDSRIVSGWEAEDGQFPHQISLRMISRFGQVGGCGGSIVHEEWGITAAHCTAGRITMMIRAGGANMTTPLHLFETAEYYNHPEYNSNLPSVVQPNDVALLKFPFKLEFNSRIQPIRLQPSVDAYRDYSDEVLIASGWGATWTSGASPEVMNWVYLRGISNTECRRWYNFSPIIVDSTICAQYYNVTSQSTCQGDSGGPLTVYDVDGKLSLVGIASFVSGAGCHTEHPGGFARPGPYHKWIKEVTGNDFDWNPYETTTKTTTEQPTTTPSRSESEEVTSPESDSEEETTQESESEEATTPKSESEEPESDSDEATSPSPSKESDEGASAASSEDEQVPHYILRFRNVGRFGYHH